MKTLLIAALCSLIFVFPAFGEQHGKPAEPALVSTPATSDPIPELKAELKLQQQKLDFFKERLDLQDKRIGDLGMILGGVIGLFGILMTIIVVFFSFRSTREAVLAAKDEARKEIEQQAGKVIGDWIDQQGKRRLEDKLQPEIEAAILKIHEAASPVLGKLAQETQATQELNQKHEQMMAEIPLQLEKLTQSQIKKVDEDAEKLESKAWKEYRSPDWLTLGIKAYHDGKYEMAADYFEKASASASKPLEAATALLYRGITLGQQGKNDEEIAAYDSVVQRYGDAPEARLREMVAKALVNKGVRLGLQGKNDEEMAIYDSVVQRYGDAPEAGLREQVAGALNNKGYRLGQQGKNDEAIAVHNRVVQCYGDAPEAGLRELVARVLNGKGFTLLCDAKKTWQNGDETSAKSLLAQALADIEGALERKPDWPMALGNQGYILFLQGKTDQAREILAKAIQLGGDEVRQAELADADIHPLPQDEAFKQLINSL